MATFDVLIPPLRTNLNDPNGTNQTAKEWYYYWKQSGDRINVFNGMIGYGFTADRPDPANAPDGALWVTKGEGEVLYQNQGGQWHYVAGEMWATLSPDERPTDLGVNDAGFTFRTTDVDPEYRARTFVWSGTAWVETTAARFDSHPTRLIEGSSMENGALWVETDRSEVLYQLQGTAWHYIAGTMWNTVVPDNRPTDLGVNDAGFHYRGTDQQREWIWSGTAWVEVTAATANYDVNGGAVGSRPTLNLIAGANVSLSGVDNAGANRVDVTIASSGGGGTGGAVTSVFGRTGAVLAATGDYNAAMVTGAVSTFSSYADPGWITSLSWSKITGAPTGAVTSVFGRTGAVVASTGDYTAAQITNAVDSTASYSNPAWITALAYSKITGAPWTIVSGGISYTGGNVGIGTASPGVALDVHGATKITYDANGLVSNAGIAQLQIVGSTNTNKAIWVGFDTSNNVGVIQAGITGTSWNNLILEPEGGFVGIATPTPGYRLDCSGDINTTGQYRVNGTPIVTGVSSVFGRTGAVVATSGDYTAAQVGAVPTARQVLAGTGMTGGGALSADITLSANVTSVFGRTGAVVLTAADVTGVGGVLNTRQVLAGTGLSGGGALSADVTLSAVPMAASGTGHAGGIVPDPGATAGSGRFLCENATWVAPPSGAVTSVFTRTGAIVAASGDYSAFYVPLTRNVLAGTGMTGGGALSADVTLTAKAMGASGASHSVGIVPDPGATAGTTRFLREDATWQVPPTGAQTPWTSNINGGNFQLTNVARIGIGISTAPTVALQVAGAGQFSQDAAGLVSSTGSAQLQVKGVTNTNQALLLGFDTTNAVGVVQAAVIGTGWNSLILNPQGGNVGIGIANPQGALQIHEGTNSNILFAAISGVTAIQCVNDAVSAYVPLQYSASSYNFTSGNVGISMSSPTYNLHLGADSAAKPTTSSWTISSGAEVKKDVKNLEGGLDVINKLRPTEAKYNGKQGTPKDQRVVSCIAEEVEKVLPGCVSRTKNEDGEEVLGFNPHEVIFHLVLAVQQLSKMLASKK